MTSSLQVNAAPRFCGLSKFGSSSDESSETKKSPPCIWQRNNKKPTKMFSLLMQKREDGRIKRKRSIEDQVLRGAASC